MGERLYADVITALRALRSTPLPVAAAIVTLAVAAGVNLAMLGLIDRALLSPPAGVADPGRVFTLGFHVPQERGGGRMTTAPYTTFRTIRDDVPALAGAAAFQRQAMSVIVEGEQLEVSAMTISGEYFGLLGASPSLGRGIAPDDNVPGSAPALVLSHAFWSSAFAADRNVLGRPLTVRGLDYVVTGVMPAGFSGHSTAKVDLWVPFAAAMRGSPGWDGDGFRNATSVVVRLDAGQNIAAAETQAGAALERRVSLVSTIGADVAPSEQRVAWWLTGISVLVFVIGLANTATLLVVRSAKTRFDLAVRAALGASKSRLVRHAILEAALVAVAAIGLASVLALWLDEAVRRVLFPGILVRAGFAGPAIGTAVVAGGLAAIVAAIANVWQLPSTVQPAHLAHSGPAGGRRSKTMTGLLLVQTTLSVLLLAGAAMFGGSLYKLWAQDFGMAMDRVLVVDVEPGPGQTGGHELYLPALDRIRRLPEVAAATVIDAIPFSGFHVPPIAVPGRAEPPHVDRQLPFLIAATPEFLQILGIRVVRGRALTEADERGAPVVIVNEAMANGVWPGEEAVGKCIRIGFDPDFSIATHDPSSGPYLPTRVPCREVVGVTANVRQRSVLPVESEGRLMQYFVPFNQVPPPPFGNAGPNIRGLLVRLNGDAEAMIPVIRRLTVGERTDLPFIRVRPYAQLLDRQMRPWSIGTTLLGLFSALALAVAAVGLYAAFAYAVAERRREMAIRMAVGARPARVLAMVLREALLLAATGVVLGCASAVVAGRWVQSLLFGTEPSDLLVLGSAAVAMLVVAAVSTWWPARSASRADPSVLLRCE
jgi:putative ABC transport system permease protein